MLRFKREKEEGVRVDHRSTRFRLKTYKNCEKSRERRAEVSWSSRGAVTSSDVTVEGICRVSQKGKCKGIEWVTDGMAVRSDGNPIG
ncbi:hypothetical protein HanPI659440_Chr03g0132431 [Helianthus annuus]|nr:hypothetical protein HanPI659440_Chr03g0132431 [Helianthus annuus]